MFYLIDGYNLIFTVIESKESLQALRQKVIRALQKQFARKKATGLLVFDGAHRRGDESGLAYRSPLTIAFAPKGQSADEYICEYLDSHSPKQTIVVTDDRGLARHARSYGAQIQTNEEFLLWLYKKKAKRETKTPQDTPHNIARLQKIFEERLRDRPDEEL
jgi:predicted RNA-binding protein with PIN domain